MSQYDDIIPWQEPSKEFLEREQEMAIAERTKQKAAAALMLATMEAARIVYDMMVNSEDEQVRLRAAEIIFSRTIPKVAAKHVEEQGEVIDSADVASLRESIVAEIKRKSNGS